MAKCIVCGKKGLFLRVNSSGRCADCESAYQAQLQEEARKKQEALQAQQERERIERKKKEAEEAERRRIEEENAPKYKDACFLDVLEGKYIIAYKYDRVNLAMVSPENGSIGDFLILVQEPDNEYDSKAVKVTTDGVTKLGYLFKGKLQDMANDWLKKDLPIEAQIDSVSKKFVTIGIAFYKDINSFRSIDATLTKTSKKDEYENSRQDNLAFVSEYDILEMEYDYDTETYIVRSDTYDELGELSASVSRKLYEQEDDFDYKVICISNDLDNNLKYKCKVKILMM